MSNKRSDHEVPREDLIALHEPIRSPHVVILGAGASLAACPTGDARGKRLPLMANLLEVLELADLITQAGFDPTVGFERLYSQMYAANPSSGEIREVERRVEEYFNDLLLPNHPTIYDLLVLSLREKDAIFTFNWDPFLVDAYLRQHGKVKLPKVFHLHGNVRVGFCAKCGVATRRTLPCPNCGGSVTPTRLLYPVEEKDYAKDDFIHSQWNQARDFIKRAFIITIFGYSAPRTDKEAMTIFTASWKRAEQERLVERVEVIDIRDREELARQWSSFSFFHHYDIRRSLFDSQLAHYPRRSCEALYHSGVKGKFVERIPWPGNLLGLEAIATDLAAYEA